MTNQRSSVASRRWKKTFWGALALLFSAAASSATPLPGQIHLKVASHELKPYHWLDDKGEFVGEALTPFKCIMSSIGASFEVDVFPLARAQEMVRVGSHDAVFVISKNNKRDQFATFSEPFLFDAWFFYYHPKHVYSLHDNQIEKRHLGVLLGSNMHRWSKKKGFEHSYVSTDFSDLFKSLDKERLEIVLATQGIYQSHMKQKNWKEDRFTAEKVRELKLGIYFSNQFMAYQPKFIHLFNEAVPYCLKKTQ